MRESNEIIIPKYSSTPPLSSSSCSSSESEELQRLETAPPFWRSNPSQGKKKLSKQLSMCETPRDIMWEKRRRQILRQGRRKSVSIHPHPHPHRRHNNNEQQQNCGELTDEDLNELKGCIELGFGFNEEEGQRLCNTLPALDLYFAVNRQFSTSPLPSPGSAARASTGSLVVASSLSSSAVASFADSRTSSSSFSSPNSDSPDSSWKICSPGDDPQQVKTKLRHWAQAVACSVMQSSTSSS